MKIKNTIRLTLIAACIELHAQMKVEDIDLIICDNQDVVMVEKANQSKEETSTAPVVVTTDEIKGPESSDVEQVPTPQGQLNTESLDQFFTTIRNDKTKILSANELLGPLVGESFDITVKAEEEGVALAVEFNLPKIHFELGNSFSIWGDDEAGQSIFARLNVELSDNWGLLAQTNERSSLYGITYGNENSGFELFAGRRSLDDDTDQDLLLLNFNFGRYLSARSTTF